MKQDGNRIKMTNETLHSSLHSLLFTLLSLSLIFLGCSNVFSPPDSTFSLPAGANSLVIRIADDSGGGRTAFPGADSITSYTISVSRGIAPLGGLSVSASGSYPVQLSMAPEAGDLVYVEGFNSGSVKIAEGSALLTAAHIAPSFTPVAVTVRFLSSGFGSVNLTVNFPSVFTAPDTGITAAEITLYSSLSDYPDGTVYRFMRYRKDDSYGEGVLFGGSSLTLDIPSLPSGNYVAKIEFFRERFVRIKTLIQTILVRDGLTTRTWGQNNGSAPLGSLTLGTGDFASSDATLTEISIEGSPVPGFAATTYSYSILKEWADETPPTLTITARAGQKIEASLNGAAVSNGSPLTLKNDSNSLVITVTAPDGVTRQTYSVSYTYRHNTVWYVDGTTDPPGRHFPTITDALNAATYGIKAVYGGTWEGKTDIPKLPVPALIQISGSVGDTATGNGKVEITDTSLYDTLPPIILAGDGIGPADEIAGGSSRVLYISNAHVILGDDLTLTGGNTSNGGGVYVAGGGFTMNGGTISGNTTSSSGAGGGVGVYSGSTFTMNGGTISGNTAYAGGGVGVSSGSFTMNGGTISGNYITVLGSSGGVYVAPGGSFTMSGGTISGNIVNGTGGGVGVNSGVFIMSGGTISGNTANRDGGGVYVAGGSFTMSGGTISGNSLDSGGDDGGGVYISGSNSRFTMSGGSISGNTGRDNGGGVCVENTGSSPGSGFTMTGGTISGNSSPSDGGGVAVLGDTTTFTMSGGTISGNKITESSRSGGGVHLNQGDFSMSGGTISGNTATDNGGGVYLYLSGATFNMTGGFVGGNTAAGGGGGVYLSNGTSSTIGGSVSGNTASNNGGGVYIGSSSTFTMTGGSAVSGNTASNSSGGGVYVNTGTFNMTGSGGSVSGNTALNGGGVYINGGTFNMTGSGGSVSGNTATGSGGGVYVTNSSYFTMDEGSVGGNTAGSNGGGVYVTNSSYFTMDGGSISGNTANTGGGVYVSGSNYFTMNGGSVGGNTGSGIGGGVYVAGNFTMGGDAEVNIDNRVGLLSGRVITLSGALTVNPAADIEPQNTAAGTQLLTNNANLGLGDPPNYQRFLVNGDPGRIAPDGTYLGP